mmetsp:Transcript_4433/g.11216  ORF Transcript_4433/g.11216 Transcript_4433/m.11216 type:complete len:93 (+) Transcript_4433:377-655(+)
MQRSKGGHGSEDSTTETLLNDDLLRECHSASDDRQRTKMAHGGKDSATETLLNNDLLHESAPRSGNKRGCVRLLLQVAVRCWPDQPVWSQRG